MAGEEMRSAYVDGGGDRFSVSSSSLSAQLLMAEEAVVVI